MYNCEQLGEYTWIGVNSRIYTCKGVEELLIQYCIKERKKRDEIFYKYQLVELLCENHFLRLFIITAVYRE